MATLEQDGSVYVSSNTLFGAGLGVKLIRGGLSSVVSSIWASTGTSATGPLVSFMLGLADSNIYKTVHGVVNVVGKGVANGLSYAEGILELSDGTNRKWDISTLTMRGTPVLHFDAANAYLSIGSATNEGDLSIMNGLSGSPDSPRVARIWLTGQTSTAKEQIGHINVMDDNGVLRIVLNGNEPALEFRDAKGKATVRLDGAKGDILLTGGDCAELFVAGSAGLLAGEVVCASEAEPGSVVQSSRSCDSKVLGVVCGAGDLKPGVLLGGGNLGRNRPTVPVALAGRVHCRAEAHSRPIRIGDFLTTSSVPGLAMSARGRRTNGAILGKALSPLEAGEGLVQTMIMLR